MLHFTGTVMATAGDIDGLGSTLPILAIDECANHPELRSACRVAFLERVIDRSIPLWAQLRRKTDGTHLWLVERPGKAALPPGEEYGSPVKGYSCPDAQVAMLLVAQLLASDRVVLVSENTRRNAGGLYDHLCNQIRPAIDGTTTDSPAPVAVAAW